MENKEIKQTNNIKEENNKEKYNNQNENVENEEKNKNNISNEEAKKEDENKKDNKENINEEQEDEDLDIDIDEETLNEIERFAKIINKLWSIEKFEELLKIIDDKKIDKDIEEQTNLPKNEKTYNLKDENDRLELLKKIFKS